MRFVSLPVTCPLCVWLALVTAALLTGCSLLREASEVPGKAVSTVLPGPRTEGPDPVEQQQQLMRFTDDFITRTSEALNDYARLRGTREAAREALAWKINAFSAAISIVSGPTPNANLIDLVTMVTLTRMVLDGSWAKAACGVAFQPWLEAARTLEREVWELAGRTLTPLQQQELREAIERWHARNPEVRSVWFVRPQSHIDLGSAKATSSASATSVFSLVGLDPMSGLDPAVREVKQSRLLAERAMFTLQRMPQLVRWHSELMAAQTVSNPDVRQVLTNVQTVAGSADRLSRVAEELPDRVAAERKEILSALEAQEGKLRALTAEVGRSLAAGQAMSTSLNTTLVTFDALMKRFGVGEPATKPPAGTNATPFNILDYARTADEITAMTKALEAVLEDFNTTLDSPGWSRRLEDFSALSRQAQADARSVLNHAFLLGAGLILLVFACALFYRRLAGRASAP